MFKIQGILESGSEVGVVWNSGKFHGNSRDLQNDDANENLRAISGRSTWKIAFYQLRKAGRFPE